MIYLTLILFLLMFLIIGYYAGKHLKDDTEGYFIADRGLNKWQIGVSAGATANSGFIVVGAVGMGYSMGLSSLIYPLAWFVGDIVFWLFFAERIRSNDSVKQSVTIPQAIAHQFSNNNLRALAGVVVFVLLLVYTAAQFIAAGKAVSAFVDISYHYALWISFIVVISYSIWGGFKSSVWTDIAQGIMMIALTLGVVVWGILEVGGISELFSAIDSQGQQYTDLVGGRGFGLLAAFVLGFGFTGFGFSISQPQVTTRIFAARSKDEVKKSKWIYIGFLHFTWMGMCLIGIIAKILMPEISDGETALPLLATKYFPDVLVGAVFAAMLATILSSVDSLLVSSSSAITIDLGLDKIFVKKISLYRYSIVLVGFVALLMSIFLESSVFHAALFAATVLSASIGSAMVLLVLNLSKSSKTLFVAIIVGLVTAITWRILELDGVINDGLVGFVVAVLISLVYQKYVLKLK